MAKGRHAPRRRRAALLIVLSAVIGGLLLACGGAAFAAMRYEQEHADRILPGVTVDGIDVGGMTEAEAVATIQTSVDAELSRPLTVTIGDRQWHTTPAALGRTAAVAAAVHRAMAAGGSLGTFERAWHRLRGEPVGVDVPLAFRSTGAGMKQFAQQLARRAAVPARDAAIGITSDHTDVAFIHARDGAKLDLAKAVAAMRVALDEQKSSVRLHTTVVHPKVTEASMGRTIVVRVDQNRLYLYDGFKVMHTYSVATAKPGYTTPSGVWTIYNKAENPTWYNPALDSWGADLPAVIPGGPGNPMGTRAIYITAPGLIRIHGTTDDSSIGRYASHGCIRMHNSEIEQLYPLIAVGQRVIVVGSRPATAGYWSVPTASDI